jgi:2,3-bisphosphoglycerate-dependent phosphoglycerate mutase
MRKLYVVRHCKAAGQDANAPLTAEGLEQAERLVEFFEGVHIDRLITSPYLRAQQTVEPLAKKRGLAVETDERLMERVLAEGVQPNWLEMLKATYEDLDLKYEGGESSREAMRRVVEAFEEVLKSDAGTTVFVTHGCLMSLLLKHFDREIGFAEWQALTNPDVYVVEILEDNCQVKRVWPGA